MEETPRTRRIFGRQYFFDTEYMQIGDRVTCDVSKDGKGGMIVETRILEVFKHSLVVEFGGGTAIGIARVWSHFVSFKAVTSTTVPDPPKKPGRKPSRSRGYKRKKKTEEDTSSASQPPESNVSVLAPWPSPPVHSDHF